MMFSPVYFLTLLFKIWRSPFFNWPACLGTLCLLKIHDRYKMPSIAFKNHWYQKSGSL